MTNRDRLNVAEQDAVHRVADRDGLHSTSYDPDVDSAMEALERTRRKYRKALRALAK